MNYATVIDYVGVPQITNYGGFDATPKVPLGTIVQASDLYWGSAEFIYLQMPVSTAAKVGTLLTYDVALGPFLGALVANTALLGKALAVLIQPLASSAVAQYGWAMISGYAPIWSSANITANNPIGIVAAGQAGALAAGKALNNTRVTAPSSTTVLKPAVGNGCGTLTGSPVVTVPNTDGVIPGMLVAGTGIPAATSVLSVAGDGKSIVMSANATANGSVQLTFTYATAADFFNLCTFNRIAAQGPIT